MIAKIIADKLEIEGHGTLGTDLFVGRLPRTPDSALLVLQTGGSSVVEVHDSDVQVMDWDVAILYRSQSYTSAMAKLQGSVQSLRPLRNTTASGYRIQIISQVTVPHVVTTDEEGRDIYQVDVHVTAEQVI